MSASITTRQTAGTGATVKGSPLTNAEVDTNFINLNTAAQPAGGTAGQVLSKIDATDFNSQWIDNYATALKFQAKNTTAGALTKGTVVYVSGGAGANPYIAAANASAEGTSATTVGIIEADVAANGFVNVVRYGALAGVDTSAATDGDPVWLSGSVAGGMVFGLANKPAAPNHLVYLGTVTRAHAVNGEIQVSVSNGWELSELHDVSITSAANNDIIMRDGTTSLWKNVSPTTARANLGLAIGVNVQAWDADLDAIAGLSGASGYLRKTATNTWELASGGGVESFNARTGAVTLSSADVTGALGFTPYNSTNPSGYITSAALSGYLTSASATSTYAPLTGTGASGTWGIDISGNAATATSAGASTTAVTLTSTQSVWSTGVINNVVGMLGWRAYGNSHVIFDASAGSSPSATSISDTNSTYAWSPAYPTLMGWNGVATYGVRVDSARQADILYSSTAAYASIYYDYNDTAYYVDPNGVSRLNRLLVYGGNSSSPTLQLQASVYPMLDMYSDDTNGNNRNWRLAGVYDSYGLFQILSSTAANGTPSTARLGISGSSGYVGIGAAATGPANWLQIGSVGSTGYSGNHIAIGDGSYAFAQYLNGGTSMDFYTTSGYFNFASTYTQMAGSSRAPIFYDSNDTAFYADPSLTSSLYNVLVGYNSSSPYVYNAASTGYLTFGSTSDPTNYSIKTVLENYNGNYSKLSLYWYTGIRHYASNYYGGHRFYDIDGTQYFGIGVGSGANWSYSVYSHRAPIFYDLDNTSYYVDPASSSYVSGEFQVQQSGVGGFRIFSGTGTQSLWVRAGYDTDGTATPVSSPYNIQFQSSGSSGGSFSFVSGNTKALSITSDYAQGAGSLRAPVFYDSDNTAYYIDPASSSKMGSLGLGGVSPDVRLSVSGDGHISSYLYLGGTAGSAGSWSARMYSSGGATYINTNTFEVSRVGYGGNAVFWTDTSENTFSLVSHRAPIFYDSNNTSYYVDPAASSVLNTIYQVGVYTRNAAGAGYLSGNYSGSETSSTTGAIYTIGGSYYPTSTSFNSMYGIGYCYADGIATGISGASGWGMYVNASGVNNVWLGGSSGQVVSTGEHRGTIYYDYNNTGYYVDPSANSRINALYLDAVYCYGNVTAYFSSDRKFKENIRPISNALDIVLAVGGKLFDWTDEYLADNGGENAYLLPKQSFGIVAQDLLPHLPQAIRTRQDGSLAVDYEKLSAVAFEAVKILEARVAQLEAR